MKNKMDMSKNKSLVLSIIVVVTLIVVVVGASYAFFVAQTGSGANTGVGVTTGTTDSLTFDAGTAINIDATQANFGQNKGNLTGTTTAKATLLANNTTNQATEHYNIFFIISANDFVYSTGTKKAELLMKITDPTGKEVTDIPGLIKTVGGFDISTRTGAFAVASNYEITSTGTIAQEWTVEVSLVNLETDQFDNTGKTFSGKVFITKEAYQTYELAKINNVTPTPSKATDSLTVALNSAEGTTPIAKYYFGIEETAEPVAFVTNKVKRLSNTIASVDTVNFVESKTPSYKFTNLKDNTNYKVYSYAEDIEGIKSNVYETVLKTELYVLPTVTNVTASNITHTSLTVTATATKGNNDIKTYYYSKDNGVNYVTSPSNTYTFNNLLEETEYKLKVKVEDTNAKYSTEYYKAVTTKRLTIAGACVRQNLALCIKTNYKLDNSIDYHTAALPNSAQDNSYRYSGGNYKVATQYQNTYKRVSDIITFDTEVFNKFAVTYNNTLTFNYYDQALTKTMTDGYVVKDESSIKNFVCFGPGATAAGTLCPEENKYRIIGVFGNQVKLIKKTSLGNKAWNSNNPHFMNWWTGSTIDTYLNGEYLNSLTTTWSDKIASNTWQIGGITWPNLATVPSTVYNYEVGTNKANNTCNSKIGLMYLSDYGFAAHPQAWTLKIGGNNDYLGDYSNPVARENNWLFGSTNDEWTMSRNSERDFNGNHNYRVFYVKYFYGGNGTNIDPYRI